MMSSNKASIFKTFRRACKTQDLQTIKALNFTQGITTPPKKVDKHMQKKYPRTLIQYKKQFSKYSNMQTFLNIAVKSGCIPVLSCLLEHFDLHLTKSELCDLIETCICKCNKNAHNMFEYLVGLEEPMFLCSPHDLDNFCNLVYRHHRDFRILEILITKDMIHYDLFGNGEQVIKKLRIIDLEEHFRHNIKSCLKNLPLFKWTMDVLVNPKNNLNYYGPGPTVHLSHEQLCRLLNYGISLENLKRCKIGSVDTLEDIETDYKQRIVAVRSTH